MKRKNMFLFFNVIVPLLFGLAIYLFCYNNTYINNGFKNIFGISPPHIYFDNAYFKFLTCWACDILWAYSLTFALFLCFKDFKKPLLICGTISFSLTIVIELLQIEHIITGTFDFWDIILEIIAILFAIIIIKNRIIK